MAAVEAFLSFLPADWDCIKNGPGRDYWVKPPEDTPELSADYLSHPSMLMFSLKWQGGGGATQEEFNPHFWRISCSSKPPSLNRSFSKNSSKIINLRSNRLRALLLSPTTTDAAGWISTKAWFGGKRGPVQMQVNPFQLNLNNQSVRELRIQAGQKAKVLLLSLLRHHLSRNVSAIHRGASPTIPLFLWAPHQ